MSSGEAFIEFNWSHSSGSSAIPRCEIIPDDKILKHFGLTWFKNQGTNKNVLHVIAGGKHFDTSFGAAYPDGTVEPTLILTSDGILPPADKNKSTVETLAH